MLRALPPQRGTGTLTPRAMREGTMRRFLAGLILVGGLSAAVAQEPGKGDPSANMNALVTQAQAAMQARNWQAAETAFRQLVAVAPARWEYQDGLGAAQYNLGRFEDALATYEKAIPLARRTADAANDNSAAAKAGVAQMLTMEGNIYLKLRKSPQAIDAFTKAAALSPNPAVAYFNLCATSYNAGNTEAALAACDKAIAADPAKADAYFIKGSVMVGNGAVDPKGKFAVPKGTVETLKKYLELQPTGAHASDVKEMLNAIK
jgi:tetratricopeptide (TPR) repeat protein